MPFCYSTLTNDHAYTNWNEKFINGQPRTVIAQSDGFKEQILIKGGANRADQRFITPLGVRTEVTERQLEVLMKNNMFKKHMAQGFITVMNSKEDPDVVAKEHMEARDPSAPYTPNSPIFQKDEEDAVKPGEGIGGRIASTVRGMLS